VEDSNQTKQSGRDTHTGKQTDESPGRNKFGRRSFLKVAAAATIPIAVGEAGATVTTHRLEIVSVKTSSETGTLGVNYEFTSTGEITPDTDNGDNSAENNDSVIKNDDGTWTATGVTGNGFGDAYTFGGQITAFDASGEFELRLDGTTITVEELVAGSKHHIEVLTTENPSEISYEFTTTGEITPDTDNGDNSAENNDSISQNDDGSWTVNGYTGNGYGDAFYFQGELTEFGPVKDFVEVYVDGTQIDLGQFEPEPSHIEVLTTENPSEISYEFTTTGEITPDTDNGDNSAENNDSISQNDDGSWTVNGYTGNGYGDAFYFQGELTEFGPVKDFVEVYVDGTQIDLGQYETADDISDPNHLGGGEGYPNTVPESDADVVVSTIDELRDTLENASRGDIVYVAGDATITRGEEELQIPAGVTLASDRGIDGSSGGLIQTNVVYGEGPLHANDDIRVTGLRLAGPTDKYVEYSRPLQSGITVNGTGCEFDNVEISGFSYSAIKLNESAHIHHSHIHSNPMEGLGYGVLCIDGQDILIEHNRFNYNRHSVANQGSAGYEVRYNRFEGKAVAYQVGTHRPGGTTLSIHHNTFVPTKHINDGDDPDSHISIRGVPDDIADIHNNWFYNTKRPSPGRGPESVIQPHVEEFTNLQLDTNHYGSDEPNPDIGCPR